MTTTRGTQSRSTDVVQIGDGLLVELSPGGRILETPVPGRNTERFGHAVLASEAHDDLANDGVETWAETTACYNGGLTFLGIEGDLLSGTGQNECLGIQASATTFHHGISGLLVVLVQRTRVVNCLLQIHVDLCRHGSILLNKPRTRHVRLEGQGVGIGLGSRSVRHPVTDLIHSLNSPQLLRFEERRRCRENILMSADAAESRLVAGCWDDKGRRRRRRERSCRSSDQCERGELHGGQYNIGSNALR
mmetsp:Transcript_15367/g.44459  ORF Transcript_15367/g.44459 Transcript_15367/m.44459 type:complete len:248 (+) Transcript_15367:1972-2715(+)